MYVFKCPGSRTHASASATHGQTSEVTRRSNKFMFYAADKNGVGVVTGVWASVGGDDSWDYGRDDRSQLEAVPAADDSFTRGRVDSRVW